MVLFPFLIAKSLKKLKKKKKLATQKFAKAIRKDIMKCSCSSPDAKSKRFMKMFTGCRIGTRVESLSHTELPTLLGPQADTRKMSSGFQVRRRCNHDYRETHNSRREQPHDCSHLHSRQNWGKSLWTGT